MQHKPNWVLALLFMSILTVPSLLAPVTAFKCVDQATCKNIDQNTRTCRQRTGEFLMDEWAYLWFRGAFETSDIGAKCEGKIHDPAGNLFMSFPLEGWGVYQGPVEILVLKAGEVVGWIGVNVTANAGQFYINSTAISMSASEKVFDYVPSVTRTQGEWRAEFMLDGKVVLSGRFRIGMTATTTTPTTVKTTLQTTVTTSIAIGKETLPSVAGLPGSLLLITTSVVIIALVGAYIYMRRTKLVSIVEPATGEVSPSAKTSAEGLA